MQAGPPGAAAPHRFPSFLELQHRHVFAPSCRWTVYILKPTWHGLFHHAVDAGLCGDSGHGHMFLAGTDTGLHDGIFPVGHCFYPDEPALAAGRACIARKFRHGESRMAVLVLLTRAPGTTSPSITYSALAMALSATVRHLHSFTGSPLSAPAMDSSSYPRGLWAAQSRNRFQWQGPRQC